MYLFREPPMVKEARQIREAHDLAKFDRDPKLYALIGINGTLTSIRNILIWIAILIAGFGGVLTRDMWGW